MRMWQPERATHGPRPATEKDIPGLNRLFADAFTDRYRRDGLVGVRVPFLNAAIWRYAIADAGEGAMLWRDESDRVVAFNIAHKSGAEGWMGPLAVRPDRQLSGLGKEIVIAAAEWLKTQGVTTLGLETMPRTVDNIGFYSRLGFVPGFLTLTMTRDVQRAQGDRPAYEVLGALDARERAARVADIGRLVTQLAPGFDFSREIQLTLDFALGNVVSVLEAGRLVAFALCHSAPLAESGTRDELRVLKIAATSADTLVTAVEAVATWAAAQNIRRVAVRCQTASADAYRALIECGYRVRWSDLRMTMTGYAEPRPAQGILWSNWEI
jgi:GNAT superfamily N-acetyltransferase